MNPTRVTVGSHYRDRPCASFVRLKHVLNNFAREMREQKQTKKRVPRWSHQNEGVGESEEGEIWASVTGEHLSINSCIFCCG